MTKIHRVETGPLEHYRHAQAFDHIGAEIARCNPPAAEAAVMGDYRETYLRGNYSDILPSQADYDWFRRLTRY